MRGKSLSIFHLRCSLHRSLLSGVHFVRMSAHAMSEGEKPKALKVTVIHQLEFICQGIENS